MAEEVVKTEELKDVNETVVAPGPAAEPKTDVTTKKEGTDAADPIEIHEDPNAWKKGLALLGISSAVAFIGGILAGRASKK